MNAVFELEVRQFPKVSQRFFLSYIRGQISSNCSTKQPRCSRSYFYGLVRGKGTASFISESLRLYEIKYIPARI